MLTRFCSPILARKLVTTSSNLSCPTSTQSICRMHFVRNCRSLSFSPPRPARHWRFGDQCSPVKEHRAHRQATQMARFSTFAAGRSHGNRVDDRLAPRPHCHLRRGCRRNGGRGGRSCRPIRLGNADGFAARGAIDFFTGAGSIHFQLLITHWAVKDKVHRLLLADRILPQNKSFTPPLPAKNSPQHNPTQPDGSRRKATNQVLTSSHDPAHHHPRPRSCHSTDRNRHYPTESDRVRPTPVLGSAPCPSGRTLGRSEPRPRGSHKRSNSTHRLVCLIWRRKTAFSPLICVNPCSICGKASASFRLSTELHCALKPRYNRYIVDYKQLNPLQISYTRYTRYIVVNQQLIHKIGDRLATIRQQSRNSTGEPCDHPTTLARTHARLAIPV